MNNDKNKIEIKIVIDGLFWGFIAGAITAAYIFGIMGV